MRKDLPIVVDGRYQGYLGDHPVVVAYTRTLGAETLAVLANFSAAPVTVEVPGPIQVAGRSLVSVYDPVEAIGPSVSLRPYEAFAVLAG